LRDGFERIAARHGVVGDIRGRGLMQCLEFVEDRATRRSFSTERAFGVRVGRRALELGLLCRFDPHWIAFGPPLVVSEEQLAQMIDVLDAAIGDELRSGPRD
jgi:adenosylmethionine-8-amino-7-oxononanoate aminotransferase